MKNSRGIKYYVRFYLIILIGYLIYITLDAYNNSWDFRTDMIIGITYIPLMFVAFVYIFDTILEKIFPRMKSIRQNKPNDQYKEFLNVCTNRINDELQLGIEDFRRLRENERFQKALHQAYEITENGETEAVNFLFLKKKFKNNTKEYKAINIVLDEVEKMM